MDKTTLLKLLNLYEEISNKNLIDEINKKYNNEIDEFKKELIKIKINSIKSEINKKKYKDKKNKDNINLYYYDNNTVKIYTKDVNNAKLIELISSIKIEKIFYISNNSKKEININNIKELNLSKKDSYLWIEKLDYDIFKKI